MPNTDRAPSTTVKVSFEFEVVCQNLVQELDSTLKMKLLEEIFTQQVSKDLKECFETSLDDNAILNMFFTSSLTESDTQLNLFDNENK